MYSPGLSVLTSSPCHTNQACITLYTSNFSICKSCNCKQNKTHTPSLSLCVRTKSLQRVHLYATPWTAAHRAPLSVGFSREEHWSWLPFPSPDLPDPGTEPVCSVCLHWQVGSLPLSHQGDLVVLLPCRLLTSSICSGCITEQVFTVISHHSSFPVPSNPPSFTQTGSPFPPLSCRPDISTQMLSSWHLTIWVSKTILFLWAIWQSFYYVFFFFFTTFLTSFSNLPLRIFKNLKDSISLKAP